MKEYVIIYRPGKRWKKNRSIDEQLLLQHAEYMDTLLNNGHLIAGGPFTDNSGGMAIVCAKNLEEAQKILLNDPAITQQVFEASLHPWQILFEQSLKS